MVVFQETPAQSEARDTSAIDDAISYGLVISGHSLVSRVSIRTACVKVDLLRFS